MLPANKPLTVPSKRPLGVNAPLLPLYCNRTRATYPMDPLVHHLLRKLALLVRNQELREKIQGKRLTGRLRNTNGANSNTGTDLVVVHRIVLLLECRRRQSGI